MAICSYCRQEMRTKVGCTVTSFDNVPRIPYPKNEELPCHDCGCPPGTYHHPGCDAERCSLCGGQAISCGCSDEPDEIEPRDSYEPTNYRTDMINAGRAHLLK